MKLQNTFVGARMNTDIDERLLPKGQYPYAENIRVANSDGSDVGAIENVKGNEKLTSLNLTNADTIGAYADGSAQKVYWFITSDTKDLVVEYDTNNSQTNILLESSNPDGVLNFNKNNLITGIVKIINGDSNKDLLIWTDDLNPPRIINIERAKTYGADGFIEQDISLVKRPPRYAPDITLTYTSATTENNMENKFLSFSYRYKYLDGGNSPLSSFTNYAFSPSEFDLDYQTMENKGMSNNFNAVNISFNTGDKRVTDVELVYKESGSNTIYLIETLNKGNEVWGDNEIKSFTFSNSKGLMALPEEELYRTFDNIPRQAKALELIGSRVAFGNYVEQYDLTNIYGEDIHMDYSLSLISLDLSGSEIPVGRSNITIVEDALTLVLTGLALTKNSRITVNISLDSTPYNGIFEDTFDYILNESFNNALELSESEDFIYFVEVLLTSAFEAGYVITPPLNSVVDSITAFSITGASVSQITIKSPSINFLIDDTPADLNDNPTNTHIETANFRYDIASNAYYREIAISTSLKTNRSYEVGIIYLDEDSRATPVLTSGTNTINVAQQYSINQNRIVVNINHKPPYWADRYKLVVKQNKGNYQTIYANLFYEDGLFRWIKLEGVNINKVRQGDTLIAKSDLGGVILDPIKVKVLEVAPLDKGFITYLDTSTNTTILSESGVYMRLKPNGLDINIDSGTARSYVGGSHLRYPVNTNTYPAFGVYDGSTFVPYPIGAGSRIRIYVSFSAKGKIAYSAVYDKSFRSSSNYNSIKDWFEAEVEDLGAFGVSFTRGGLNVGYGFSADSSLFYARSHRDGTSSRNITTNIQIDVISSAGTLIFETEAEDKASGLFYETAQTFDIVDNYHEGNIQNQSATNPTAIVELDFFNSYVQGNGAESYRYLDAYNVGTNGDGNQLLANYLDIDLRPSTTSLERYKEVRRYADITYSEPYNENTNLNGLGVFNLSKANYKEDIEKKYGFIQKLYARDTNLVVFQEDKVSYVLYGKDIITNADGSGNVSSIEDVLGQQVMYTGEYGISRNPESFAFDANNIYFMDSKRGCVCRLGAQGISEISMSGMRTFFKDDFKNAIDNKKLGSYDPYLDQYVVHSSEELLVQPVNIDCSETFYRGGVTGVYIINIDFGVLVGEVGFNYQTNNGIQAIFEYNGITTDLGTLTGTGTYSFNKGLSLPRVGKLTITAAECDTNFEIAGNCVVGNSLNVITVILNGIEDEAKLAKSRYKWFTNTYSSPFTTYDNLFNINQLEVYDNIVDSEGSVRVPLTGSTIRIENYSGFIETLEFEDGIDRLGYLISNTLYTDAQIESLLAASNFPTETKVINGDGSITRFIEFNFNRGGLEQYLYLIWDYVQKPIAVDDIVSATLGEANIINLVNNDINLNGGNLNIVIDTNPSNGTILVNGDGTITYTHDGSNNLFDSFTYHINDGTYNSNIATVSIGIGISAGDSINTGGQAGVYLIPFIVGTGGGDIVAHFNAQGVPDRFQILFDTSGNSNNIADMEVVADSLFVGDNLSDTVPANGTYSPLDLYTYNGATFGTAEVGTQSVTVADVDVATIVGNRTDITPNGESRNSSGGAQIGVQNLVYTSTIDTVGTTGLTYGDGNIALRYAKPSSLAYVAYIRVYGLTGTAWNLFRTEFINE